MRWWCPLWAVVYREAAAAAAAATDDVDGLLWSADGVCSPREFSEECPEWLLSDCWPRECEDKERPGRARDGNLSIILLTPSRLGSWAARRTNSNQLSQTVVQLIVQLTSTKRRWTERYCASSFCWASPLLGKFHRTSLLRTVVLRIDWNSIKCNKLSNCFIGTDHHRGDQRTGRSVANGELIGTASNWRTVGSFYCISKGTCVQSDGLLVAIKSGSLLLEKWKPTSAGGSLGFRLIHGIYSTGGVLMCDLPIRCGQI